MHWALLKGDEGEGEGGIYRINLILKDVFETGG